MDDRRPRWRRAVYASSTLTSGQKVVLLFMGENMSAKGIVSTPRLVVAESLRVDPARVTEAVAAARRNGYLDTVSRGKPGFTAVYQALLPTAEKGAESAPLNHNFKVRKPGGDMVRKSHPSTGAKGTEHGAESAQPKSTYQPQPKSPAEPHQSAPEKQSINRGVAVSEANPPEAASASQLSPSGSASSKSKDYSDSDYKAAHDVLIRLPDLGERWIDKARGLFPAASLYRLAIEAVRLMREAA